MDDLEEREHKRRVQRKKKRAELVSRRTTLLAELDAVRVSLEENGENINHFESAYADPKPVSKSEFHGLLAPGGRGFSTAGVQSVQKLFDELDIDGDGVLNYSEFHGYLNAVNQLHEFDPTVLKSEDAFQAYMDDLYELKNGGLSFGGFLVYRFEIEEEHSLVDDLEKLGFETMNDMIKDHQIAARSFDWFDPGADGYIEKEDFQLLCYRAGIPLYTVQCEQILDRQQVQILQPPLPPPTNTKSRTTALTHERCMRALWLPFH